MSSQHDMNEYIAGNPQGGVNNVKTAGVNTSNGNVTNRRLTKQQSKIIEERSSRRKILEEEEGAHHTSHEKAGSIINVLAAGIINYLLMFGLCCAYGMIMFGPANKQHRSLGVKMNLCTATITGFLLAWRCGVKVAIGGPDLNPVVFLGGFIATISSEIAEQQGLVYPESKRRLEMLAWEDFRRLGGGDDEDVEWCVGYHYKDHMEACDTYSNEVRATAIFATAVSSALLGLLFFLSGKFHLTRYASYVPTCVMEAFMSCVGYKVFKYALKFCKYSPQQFIPAACVGVPLYFVKAYHIGNPAVAIPLMLFIPLGIFYIVVYGSGSDLDHVEQWMFPKMDNIEFWKISTDGFGSYQHINIKAWMKTIPDLMVMLIVCFIDCLLKLLGTEGKLPVKVDKDREMQLFGIGNLLTTACGSSVGYMQLKFNVINYGILGNAKDRRASYVYATLCAITFFSTIEHFNFLPRFFLGILLFFAGAGFVCENLWGSRKFLSTREWGQILLILAMFIISGDMLYAVLFGVILTCSDFILTYSKVPCVAEEPYKRCMTSCVRRNDILQNTLRHIADEWMLVVKLKGFVFFASAQTLVARLRDILESQDHDGTPPYKRLRYLIFDLKLVDGMDASTAKTLRKLTIDAKSMKVSILYTNCRQEMEQRLLSQELATMGEIFPILDDALHCIEDRVLCYMKEIQKRWHRLHPAFASNQRMALQRVMFEPWTNIVTDKGRMGVPWKYCSAMEANANSSCLWKPGEVDVPLFLVHAGSIAVYRELPDENMPAEEWPSPLACYTQGWFINREALIGMCTRGYAVGMEDSELIFWTRQEWTAMLDERPHMGSELQRAVMQQQAHDILWNELTLVGAHKEIPQDLQKAANRLRIAQALGAFGMYELEGNSGRGAANAEGFLPELPPAVVHDLEYAFHKYGRPVEPKEMGDEKSEGSSLARSEEEANRHRARTSASSFSAGPSVEAMITGISNAAHLKPGFSRESIVNLTSKTYCMEQEQAGDFAKSWQLTKGSHTRGTIAQSTADIGKVISLDEVEVKRRSKAASGQSTELTGVLEEVGTGPIRNITFLTPELRLPSNKVSQALMFVGEFGSQVKLDGVDSVSWQEFLAIATEVLLLRLQSSQVQRLKDSFQRCAEGSSPSNTLIPRSCLTLALAAAVKDVAQPQASEEPIREANVQGLADEWAGDGSAINQDGFLVWVSRLARLHEKDHCLWRGMQELCGNTSGNSQDPENVLTYKNLTQSHLFNDLQAQEMLWAADWRLAQEGKGESLNMSDAFTAITLPVWKIPAKLPVQGEESPKWVGDELDPEVREIRTTIGGTTHYELAAPMPMGDEMPGDQEETIQSESSKLVSGPELSRRAQLHIFFDDPNSSRNASIWWMVMGMLIIVSVMTMFLQPLISEEDVNAMSETEKLVWFIAEAFFTSIFTIDYLVRLSVADALGTMTIRRFMVQPGNIADVMSVIPFYVELALGSEGEHFRLLRVIRLLRLTRISRIARLAKRHPLFGPVAAVMLVVWFIYLKTGG